jgi:hypothetical protein
MPSKRPTTDDTTPADGPTTSSIGEYDLPKTVVTKIAKSAVSSYSRGVVLDFISDGWVGRVV